MWHFELQGIQFVILLSAKKLDTHLTFTYNKRKAENKTLTVIQLTIRKKRAVSSLASNPMLIASFYKKR